MQHDGKTRVCPRCGQPLPKPLNWYFRWCADHNIPFWIARTGADVPFFAAIALLFWIAS